LHDASDTNSPPTNLILTQLQDNRIFLSWKAPEEKPVAYRVIVGDEDSNIEDSRRTELPSFILDRYERGYSSIVSVRAEHQPFWSDILGPKVFKIGCKFLLILIVWSLVL